MIGLSGIRSFVVVEGPFHAISSLTGVVDDLTAVHNRSYVEQLGDTFNGSPATGMISATLLASAPRSELEAQRHLWSAR